MKAPRSLTTFPRRAGASIALTATSGATACCAHTGAPNSALLTAKANTDFLPIMDYSPVLLQFSLRRLAANCCSFVTASRINSINTVPIRPTHNNTHATELGDTNQTTSPPLRYGAYVLQLRLRYQRTPPIGRWPTWATPKKLSRGCCRNRKAAQL